MNIPSLSNACTPDSGCLRDLKYTSYFRSLLDERITTLCTSEILTKWSREDLESVANRMYECKCRGILLYENPNQLNNFRFTEHFHDFSLKDASSIPQRIRSLWVNFLNPYALPESAFEQDYEAQAIALVLFPKQKSVEDIVKILQKKLGSGYYYTMNTLVKFLAVYKKNSIPIEIRFQELCKICRLNPEEIKKKCESLLDIPIEHRGKRLLEQENQIPESVLPKKLRTTIFKEFSNQILERALYIPTKETGWTSDQIQEFAHIMIDIYEKDPDSLYKNPNHPGTINHLNIPQTILEFSTKHEKELTQMQKFWEHILNPLSLGSLLNYGQPVVIARVKKLHQSKLSLESIAKIICTELGGEYYYDECSIRALITKSPLDDWALSKSLLPSHSKEDPLGVLPLLENLESPPLSILREISNSSFNGYTYSFNTLDSPLEKLDVDEDYTALLDDI